MSQRFPEPGIEEVRSALRRHRPELAGHRVSRLGEGWDFVAFTAGDFVVRVPKTDTQWTPTGTLELQERLKIEYELYGELATELPLPTPQPKVYEAGPNGLPFTIYPLLPGVSLSKLGRAVSRDFGATLGGFIKALHAFPAERAAAIGLEVLDGARTRKQRIAWYETLARRVFPLLSCEARSYTVDRFEAYLNEPANFAFEPVLVHSDIDERNLLGDPETGALSGAIDFGDAHVGDPAGDFTWALRGGFERLGIVEQIPDLMRESGVSEAEIHDRCNFYEYVQPLHQIIYGLDIEDRDEVSEGIERLNASVPFGTRC